MMIAHGPWYTEWHHALPLIAGALVVIGRLAYIGWLWLKVKIGGGRK